MMRLVLCAALALALAGCGSDGDSWLAHLDVEVRNGSSEPHIVTVEAQEHAPELDGWATYLRIGTELQPGETTTASEAVLFVDGHRLLVKFLGGPEAAYLALDGRLCLDGAPVEGLDEAPRLRVRIDITGNATYDVNLSCPDGSTHRLA